MEFLILGGSAVSTLSNENTKTFVLLRELKRCNHDSEQIDYCRHGIIDIQKLTYNGVNVCEKL